MKAMASYGKVDLAYVSLPCAGGIQRRQRLLIVPAEFWSRRVRGMIERGSVPAQGEKNLRVGSCRFVRQKVGRRVSVSNRY